MTASEIPFSENRSADVDDMVRKSADTQRDQWLRARREVISGTDVAKVLGFSKWGGPMDVYLDKLGLLPERADNEPMKSGRRLERPILEWYADERAGGAHVVFEPPFYLRRSTIFDRVGATLDAVRYDVEPVPGSASLVSGSPVDAKNIRHHSGDWGEDGTDQMPLYYAAQLVAQMHVTGATFADLAVLFSGQDLRVYRLHRDSEVEADLMGQCQRFYTEHVLKEIPPPVDASPAYAEYLKKLVHQTTEEVKPATSEIHDAAVNLHAAKVALDVLEGDARGYENMIKAFIGEGAKVVGSNWSATWSKAKDTVGTDWKAVALALHATLDEASALCLGSSETPDKVVRLFQQSPTLTALVEKNQIVTRAGSRRFTFNFKGDR